MKLHKLIDFSEVVVVNELAGYTWVIETRELDDAGTPHDEEWEVWSAWPADGKRIGRYPQKNSIMSSYLKEIQEDGAQKDLNYEVRIKLARRVEREEDIAATEPWVFMN
jgi:hypothetical protein